MAAIKAVTTLWWKAWLEDDVDARKLLSSADLRPLAVVERKGVAHELPQPDASEQLLKPRIATERIESRIHTQEGQ